MFDWQGVLNHFPRDFAILAVQLALTLSVFMVFMRQAWRFFAKLPGQSAWFVSETQRMVEEETKQRVDMALVKAKAKAQITEIARLKEELALLSGNAKPPQPPLSPLPASPLPAPVAVAPLPPLKLPGS